MQASASVTHSFTFCVCVCVSVSVSVCVCVSVSVSVCLCLCAPEPQGYILLKSHASKEAGAGEGKGEVVVYEDFMPFVLKQFEGRTFKEMDRCEHEETCSMPSCLILLPALFSCARRNNSYNQPNPLLLLLPSLSFPFLSSLTLSLPPFASLLCPLPPPPHSFDAAVDTYFSEIESHKLEMRAVQQERAAVQRMETAKKSHQRRVEVSGLHATVAAAHCCWS